MFLLRIPQAKLSYVLVINKNNSNKKTTHLHLLHLNIHGFSVSLVASGDSCLLSGLIVMVSVSVSKAGVVVSSWLWSLLFANVSLTNGMINKVIECQR